MFDSYFLKSFLRIFFENIENIIFVLFKKCFYYLNLVFYVFLRKKKKKKKGN